MLLVAGVAAAHAQRPITGHVFSALDKRPITGASVTVVSTGMIAVTNDKGAFTVLGGNGPVALLVRAIAFKRKTVTVQLTESAVDVTLEPDVFNLEAVVVTGQATAVEQRNLANAVSTVTPEQLARAPTPTLESALQGKVPGALIQMNSGAPGGGGQINLRGVTTINAGVDPLIVVDGLVISNDAIPSGMNAVTAAAGGGNSSNQDNPVNRLADLNPNDIASVQVLKGASAAAIYGSQAANGVIMITTRRGQQGAPRFTVTQRVGQYRVANSLGSRAFRDSAEAVTVFPESSLVGQLCRGSCPVFNNEAALYGLHSLSEETAATVSGGSDQTQYFFSGLVKHDGGVAPNTGYQKQSLRGNVDQVLSSRVHLSLNSQVIHSRSNRGISNNDNTGTSTYLVLPFTPSFMDLRPKNGVYPTNPFAPSNPLQTFALLADAEDVWRVLGTTQLRIDAMTTATQSLSFTAAGGADYFSQRNDILSPPELQFEPQDGQPGTVVLGKASDLRLNLLGNVVHTYTPASGAFVATSSAGFQYQNLGLNITSILGRNFLNGQQNVSQASSINVAQTLQPQLSLGLYAQEEVLALDRRLLATVGIRADRSSVNGDAHAYYYFPKAALSYRFVQALGGVDELKLRGAWGQTGNPPVFGSQFLQDATGTLGGRFGTFVSVNAGNASIKPERNTEVEGGFDATLANELFNVSFTAFRKTITDLLLLQTLAPSTGVGTRLLNGGKLRTQGVEAALAVSPVRTPAVNWIVRGSFALNRSKVMELPVPAFLTGGFGTGLGAFKIEQGKSATQIVGSEGPVGDANPKFQMYLSSDFGYHRVSLGMTWDWKKGGDVINLTQLLYDAGSNSPDWNSGGSQRWATFLSGKTKPYVQDGSYLKLRELNITYTLPPEVTAHLFGGVRSARISLSGRNLIRITPYQGLEPEVSNFGNQAIARNIDVAPFPPNRSFFLSVDLGF
jgi:TonB-linked SusC/RagA family outer membrane protein